MESVIQSAKESPSQISLLSHLTYSMNDFRVMNYYLFVLKVQT